MADNHIIINVGRQFGSGGKAVAQELGRLFDVPVYDGELLSAAARESGFGESLFNRSDERRRYWNFGAGLNDAQLFKFQSETIRSIAEKGPAIFVGRASDYVLRDMDCLDVFISSPLEKRIEEVSSREGISAGEAERKILRIDRERADYYNFFTFTKWGDGANYDLCIDSSILGIEGTASFIKEFYLSSHNK